LGHWKKTSGGESNDVFLEASEKINLGDGSRQKKSEGKNTQNFLGGKNTR